MFDGLEQALVEQSEANVLAYRNCNNHIILPKFHIHRELYLMRNVRFSGVASLALALTLAGAAPPAIAAPAESPAASHPHNVILFVADGLRYGSVVPEVAPEMASIKAQGVDFTNSHSMYPTVTTVNASALATGHGIGDTGDFGNSAFVGLPPLPSASLVRTPFYEDDVILGDMNARYAPSYLDEETILAAARAAGFQSAAIGKLGPTAIQDVTARDGTQSIIIDDATGHPDSGGLPLADDLTAALKQAGLGAQAPDRGLNQSPGTFNNPGAIRANVEQQDWFTDVATRVVLPRFKAGGRPFFMVFWSRDPDGSQHNQGDSLNALTPGINGPTSIAAIHNADNDLGRLRAALKAQGLDQTTDIIVVADHGFTTISRQSATSSAAKIPFPDDVNAGFLPPGFLAIDLAQALKLKLNDANGLEVDLAGGRHPASGSALLGDANNPDVIIAANGGSDLLWLPQANARELAPKIVESLIAQDYVSAIFVDDRLGSIPGTLPTSAIGLKGAAVTPEPAIIVSFKSFATGCPDPLMCAAEVADTSLQQGQGMHGSLSRAETRNFMAAIGPDFKAGFKDPAPVSNADIGATIGRLLGLSLRAKGKLVGRIADEALTTGGAAPVAKREDVASTPATGGFITVLHEQRLDGHVYYDSAGMPGRVVTGD